MTLRLLPLAVCCATLTVAQTRIDLRAQGKSADLSSMGPTKTFQTDTILPASCVTGQMFFKTDARPGGVLFACTGSNLWTELNTNEIPSAFGNTGKLIATDGTNVFWTGLLGDLSGGPAAATVTALQGRSIANVAPLDGNVLKWNAALARWEPGAGSSTGSSGGSASPLNLSTGVGLIMAQNAGNTILSVDTAVVPTLLSDAQLLTVAAIPGFSCVDNTFILQGATLGDAVAPGWPASLPLGLSGIMRVTAANTIGIRICNPTATASAGINDVFRATIIRSF